MQKENTIELNWNFSAIPFEYDYAFEISFIFHQRIWMSEAVRM